jgi:hypothetical protein
MYYLFLDESGDLGLNKNDRSSNHFIITILISDEVKQLEKLVKNSHKMLRKNIKKLSGGVLHSVKEKPRTRIWILKKLSTINIKIMILVICKSKIRQNILKQKHLLYNYLTSFLIHKLLVDKFISLNDHVNLIAERRETNKFLNENFGVSLVNELYKNHKLNITVSVKTASQSKPLQLVDFVSWAIFRKYEYKDNMYYDVIKSKIHDEYILSL